MNIHNHESSLIQQAQTATLLRMITRAEKKLNPQRHHLTFEAKKRLRWLYMLYYEENSNVTRTANRIGISRAWLSHLRSVFEKSGRDPRTLEPASKAPHDTRTRKRISRDVEETILNIRRDSKNVWGKEKITHVLRRDYGMRVSPNTVNRYLHKHNLIDPKLSLKNEGAWRAKKARETMEVELRVKYRPPREIKDLLPGALIEKDMKYVPKSTQITTKKNGENFWSQHTDICSFTRIRALELVPNGTAAESRDAHVRSVSRLPFPIACENTDNGSENNRELREQLQNEQVFHFYSNVGTPTDNPRVERSHLTDEVEFYRRGGLKKTFEEQKKALAEWEYFYNWKRPHQALGYLTPMEFFELWQRDAKAAHAIVEKYQEYLKKQRIRLANARKIKKREQIDALMTFIEAKTKNNKTHINRSKLQLINCQLCSLA